MGPGCYRNKSAAARCAVREAIARNARLPYDGHDAEVTRLVREYREALEEESAVARFDRQVSEELDRALNPPAKAVRNPVAIADWQAAAICVVAALFILFLAYEGCR